MAGPVTHRSREMALVLCFLFGALGGHWFYLGRLTWGLSYLAVTVLWFPVGMALTMMARLLLGEAASGAVGGLTFVVPALLLAVVLYDLVCLLCMNPADFDQRYN